MRHVATSEQLTSVGDFDVLPAFATHQTVRMRLKIQSTTAFQLQFRCCILLQLKVCYATTSVNIRSDITSPPIGLHTQVRILQTAYAVYFYFTNGNNEPTCIPKTAKMKTMIASTKHRFPRAPRVWPMIPINRLSVGHDLASLNTRSYKQAEHYAR